MSAGSMLIETTGEVKEFGMRLTRLLYEEGRSSLPKKEYKTAEEVKMLLKELEDVRQELFNLYEHNKASTEGQYYIE